MNEPCFPCIEAKCQEVVEVNCSKKICNSCVEPYNSNCVFLNEKIMCTNGKLYIEAGTNLNNALSQLLCEIDRLKEQIKFIMEGGLTGVCDIPQILNITD